VNGPGLRKQAPDCQCREHHASEPSSFVWPVNGLLDPVVQRAFILAEAPHRKQIDRMTSTIIQKLVLAIYRLPFVNAMFRTRIGSSFYVVCYDIYKNFLEAAGSQALARHIGAGTWAIDVGANVGFFTERFARWVKDGGRVIAIEPDGENLVLLRRRLAAAHLDCVYLHQAVAVEKSGSVRLQRNPQQPSDHRISEVGDPVAAVTLDELVEQAGSPRIGLIKIDTQGSEHRVLAGAARTLQRCRPNLFIEVDDGALRESGASAAQVIRQLEAHGYQFFTITRSGEETPMQADAILQAVASTKHGYMDVLCVAAPDGPQSGR
jgi:FkbM family methyltransferase